MGDRKPIPPEEKVRCAYYGINGSGKSTCISYMAKLGTVVAIDGEGGFRRRRLAELGIPLDNIEIAISESDPDLPGASIESLDALFWELKAELADDPTAIAGLIWDTTTDSQKVMIDQLRVDKHALNRRKLERTNRSKPTDQREDYELDPFFIDVDWYGIYGRQMNKVLRQFRDLPCHWAIACQEERREPRTGPHSIGPAMTPSTQGDVMGYSDYVCRLSTAIDAESGETIYLGTFRTHGIAIAKDRDSIMPNPMVSPTFERVVLYATGQLTAEDDIQQQDYLEARGLGKVDESGRPKRRRASEETRGAA